MSPLIMARFPIDPSKKKYDLLVNLVNHMKKKGQNVYATISWSNYDISDR